MFKRILQKKKYSDLEIGMSQNLYESANLYVDKTLTVLSFFSSAVILFLLSEKTEDCYMLCCLIPCLY